MAIVKALSAFTVQHRMEDSHGLQVQAQAVVYLMTTMGLTRSSLPEQLKGNPP